MLRFFTIDAGILPLHEINPEHKWIFTSSLSLASSLNVFLQVQQSSYQLSTKPIDDSESNEEREAIQKNTT